MNVRGCECDVTRGLLFLGEAMGGSFCMEDLERGVRINVVFYWRTYRGRFVGIQEYVGIKLFTFGPFSLVVIIS